MLPTPHQRKPRLPRVLSAEVMPVDSDLVAIAMVLTMLGITVVFVMTGSQVITWLVTGFIAAPFLVGLVYLGRWQREEEEK